jgi:tetratricopeptide (TPR) repeat protein
MKYTIRISLLLLLLVSQDGIACTSFSVSSGENKVLYGYNFDYYPNSLLFFLIKPGIQKKVFHIKCENKMGHMVSLAGMNTEGLFANMQMLYPYDLSGWRKGSNTNFFWEIYERSLMSFGSVQDVRVWLNERRLIQGYGVTLHSMFADKHGDALVVEAGHEGNKIVNKKDKFLVMTNFPNSDFVNVAVQEVEGGGSERYKAAYNYLLQNSDSFCVDSGMELLKNVVNTNPSTPTRCSFVFDPEQALVYLSLERNFDKIWRVSIEKSTIETWKGFQSHKLVKIGKAGMWAHTLVKEALTVAENTFGSNHPNFATSLNNLAAVYQAQGKYAQAEPLHKRALKIREKAFGPEHPDVGQSLKNLAAVYQAQGRYAEAEPLYKRALKIREKAFGPEHPDVGQSLKNLAELYRAQGRYAEAEPLYKRALAINEKAFGRDHPEVVTNLNNLALLYDPQGRYAEAEPLYKRVLAVVEKALGPEHPHVATTYENLAELYKKMGKKDEAQKLEARAKKIRSNR